MAGKQNRIDNEQEFKDTIKSISYMLKRGDTLIKSEDNPVMSSDYDLFRNIKVKKTGKEIKEAVLRMVDLLKSKKENSKMLIASLIQEIQEKPNESMKNNYRVTEYPGVFDYVPFRFEYNQIYSNNGTYINEEEGKKMQQYNREAECYIDKCLDVAKLSKVAEIINEKASYKITPNFALKLRM